MRRERSIKCFDGLTLLIFLCAPLPVLALSTDKQQPINLEADTADIDDKTGISIYRGNAVAVQGTIRITGDTITLYSPNKTLERAVVEGKPAHYKQRPDNKPEDMLAQGDRMEYFVDTDKLLLLGNAHIWQDKDEMSGNRIDYDLQLQVGKATKGKTDRVQVVIQPKKLATPNAPLPTPPNQDRHPSAQQ